MGANYNLKNHFNCIDSACLALARISNVLILSTIVHCTEKESKDTLSDESSEELKKLKSKSYDDSEKQGLPSSTLVVEPQSEIAMDKSDLTKESEVVAVYYINAK